MDLELVFPVGCLCRPLFVVRLQLYNHDSPLRVILHRGRLPVSGDVLRVWLASHM